MLQLCSVLFYLQLESLELQKSMSCCLVISFCMFFFFFCVSVCACVCVCVLEGEYSFALLFEMHYLVIIHLLVQDSDAVWH